LRGQGQPLRSFISCATRLPQLCRHKHWPKVGHVDLSRSRHYTGCGFATSSRWVNFMVLTLWKCQYVCVCVMFDHCVWSGSCPAYCRVRCTAVSLVVTLCVMFDHCVWSGSCPTCCRVRCTAVSLVVTLQPK